MKQYPGMDVMPRGIVVALPQRETTKPNQHHYFIEVWTDLPEEGGSFLETISIATDHDVSMAALRQAMKRRPGKALVHFNGQHRMSGERAPEQPPPLG